MSILTILPTYNEAENLSLLIQEILTFVPKSNILVVDDNSPDQTGALANALAKTDERIHVLHRKTKEGLGKAYLAGFQWALTHNFEKIIQMDADGSHPPSRLPRLVEGLDHFDFVLGSRYLPLGGVKNWSVFRQWISKGGNLYARKLLASPIRDLTGGFKGFRKNVLEYLLQNPITSEGYCFQIETTFRAFQKGFTYEEIPFIFTERRSGHSKMSKAIVWEAIFGVYRLKNSVKQPRL